MAPKRHLGLAKAGKAKRLKTLSPTTDAQDSVKVSSVNKEADPNSTPETNNGTDIAMKGNDQLPDEKVTVELSADVDVNDAMGQLRVLWRNFIASEERNELMVNAVVHECDRMLRKLAQRQEGNIDEEKIVLLGDFYSIYAIALSSLAFFHTENPNLVKEFFEAARDRIETGKRLYPNSISVLFAEARILINLIPLTEISQLEVDSKINSEHKDASVLLDRCLNLYEEAEKLSEERKEFSFFNRENSDFLDALDDLLEIVDNFGREHPEGDDSDASDSPDEVVLNKKHPLYAIRKTDKYSLWWREHCQRFLENLEKNLELVRKSDDQEEISSLINLKREMSKRLGDSFLAEAEMPTTVFTTLAYYSRGEKEVNGMNLEQSRELCKSLYKKALVYLKEAEDEEDPDSWASVAEATISLGNIYDISSEEQEKLYKEAESILIRANNATNGKYESILENLVQG